MQQSTLKRKGEVLMRSKGLKKKKRMKKKNLETKQQEKNSLNQFK